MVLCKHIQPIYEEEIRKGNTVVGVDAPENTICALAVEMKRELPETEPCSGMKAERPPRVSPHYPLTIEYFCRACKCMVFSCYGKSLDDPYKKPNSHILATPQNVYVEDGYYCSRSLPTMITEGQRQEIETYWSAHPDEKEKLYQEMENWYTKKGEASETWFNLEQMCEKNPSRTTESTATEQIDQAKKEYDFAAQKIAEISKKLVLGYGWENDPSE